MNCENLGKEELMKNLMAYKFAINDMSLFLDTHPNDARALSLHNEYVSEFNRIKEKYQNEYGPITFETEMDSWQWVSDEWPWEKEV